MSASSCASTLQTMMQCGGKLAFAILAVTWWLAGCAVAGPEDAGPPGNDAPQDARAFPDQNKLRPGIVETASGLQYEIVRTGDGARPTLDDAVHVFYAGRQLGSDDIIDRNRSSDSPDRVAFRNTIAGWREALLLMPEGSTYIFYIPSRLAYGEEGRGVIGPNKVLVYRIELVKVESSR